jgi:hypothetical protein
MRRPSLTSEVDEPALRLCGTESACQACSELRSWAGEGDGEMAGNGIRSVEEGAGRNGGV